MAIPDSFIDDLVGRIDIADLVGGYVKLTNYSTGEVTVTLDYINNPSYSLIGSFYGDSGYTNSLDDNTITLPRGPGKAPEECDSSDETDIHPQTVWLKLEGGLTEIIAEGIMPGTVIVLFN